MTPRDPEGSVGRFVNSPVVARVDPRKKGDRHRDVESGSFVSHVFTHASGSLVYQLYIPSTYEKDGEAMPLVVMLHGCTQSPDDFAAGTRMNALAEEYGFLVVYPAQAVRANGSKCWNWFVPRDQSRGGGEPSVISGIVREVIGAELVDPQRVFVAGLSAGAGMAVILGATYPDVFAAVGAHSGLAYQSAHNVPSAFQVMRDGAAQPDAPAKSSQRVGVRVPLIVFHGDKDQTVSDRNAVVLVEQSLAAISSEWEQLSSTTRSTIEGGRPCTVTTYLRGSQVSIEHWTLHGGGHAWSGGCAAGSFTDAAGPDASRKMIEFFLGERVTQGCR